MLFQMTAPKGGGINPCVMLTALWREPTLTVSWQLRLLATMTLGVFCQSDKLDNSALVLSLPRWELWFGVFLLEKAAFYFALPRFHTQGPGNLLGSLYLYCLL